MRGSELLGVARSQVDNLSIFEPAAPPSHAIRTLSILLFAISALIFVVVEGILVYNLLRFRVSASAPTSEPPQVYGGTPIEIAWTVAPTLIVCILVLVMARTLWEVDLDPPPSKPGDDALFVTVVGRQWWWEYRYDSYNGQPLGFITANELHVPAGQSGARPARLSRPSIGRRLSQLLGAASGRQDRPHPRPVQSHVVSDPRDGNLLRAVCRILRHPARGDAVACDRRSTRGLRALAHATKSNPHAMSRRPRRQSDIPDRIVRQLSSRPRYAGCRDVRPRSDAPHESSDTGSRSHSQ